MAEFAIKVREKPKASVPVPVAPPTSPQHRADFMRGGRGVVFNGWRPALRGDQDAVSIAWDDAAARAQDITQNSGWISGAIDQAVANIVGTGLRLKSSPENTQFGMTEADARIWSRLVESRWEVYTRNPYECDVEARRTFGQMQAAQLRSFFAFGEHFAELPWRVRPGGMFGTKVRLVPPHRISRESSSLNGVTQGVRMDLDGMPLAYLATARDRIMGERTYEVPARDEIGRSRVIHVFDGKVGQVRGITPLVPALQVARQFDQLADATLTAAIIQTVFAASITADTPTEEVLEGLLTPQEMARMGAEGISAYDAWFEASAGWYDRSVINTGISGRVTHLFPGQKMEFHSAQHPSGNYKDFALHLLRETARCLGLTYESATGDYDGATYSSVRMAVNEIFAITLYRRQNIIAPFCQGVYEAWLEEEVQRARIPFPGGLPAFLANRSAACRAQWRGAPKPVADDVKAATTHQTYRKLGVVSDEMICNDLGVDVEDVYAQRAREKELRDEYGLDDLQEQEISPPAPDPAGGGDPANVD